MSQGAIGRHTSPRSVCISFNAVPAVLARVDRKMPHRSCPAPNRLEVQVGSQVVEYLSAVRWVKKAGLDARCADLTCFASLQVTAEECNGVSAHVLHAPVSFGSQIDW